MTMRKYLKPALEIEAFDVEDVITASGTTGTTPVIEPGNPGGQVITPPGEAAAPIEMIELN